MPHTSRKRKSTPQKRTAIMDEEGWIHVGSHHDPQKRERRASDWSRVDSSQIADGMTAEKLSQRYSLLEKKWHASESCKRLSKALHDAIQANHIEVKSCLCFGSGSMTGLRHNWIDRHDVALYQIAAFKTAIDAIGQAQSRRPIAYAQEPAYNLLDEQFLNSLNIVTVDSPGGWDLIDSSSSFCYCPGAEQFVSINVIEKDPGFYMAGPLPWLRERQVDNLSTLPKLWEGKSRNTEEERIQMIDKFIDKHDVCTLPDLDAADYPFYDQALYWRKAHDAS